MQYFIVHPHSFVDLITNSSSELFICNKEKSIDSVKEILTEICRLYNEKAKLAECEYIINLDKLFASDDADCDDRYEHIFGSITVSEYTIDWCEERHNYLYNKGDFSNNCPEKVAADNLLNEWCRVNKSLKETNIQEYNRAQNEYIEKIYCNYHNELKRSYILMIKHYCTINSIPFEDAVKGDKLHYSQYYHSVDLDVDPKYKDFIDAIDNAIDWGMTIKKGDVLIESAGDNTIPYDLFEDIKFILRATRHHLG